MYITLLVLILLALTWRIWVVLGLAITFRTAFWFAKTLCGWVPVMEKKYNKK